MFSNDVISPTNFDNGINGVIPIIIAGSEGVGKTSLKKLFRNENRPQMREIKGFTIPFEIIIETSKESFENIISNSPKFTGVIIVYDITNNSSFEYCKTLLQKTAGNPKVLVGNKCDMSDNLRRVPEQNGKELAKRYSIEFFETSTTNNNNINEVFDTLVKKVKVKFISEVFIPYDKIKIIEDFEHREGAYGEVFKVMYNNEFAALKEIKKYESFNEMFFFNEVKALKNIRDRVVNFYGMVIKDKNHSILMEWMEYNLKDLISDKNENIPPEYKTFSKRFKFLMDSCDALKWIHGSNYIHGDIKPENILINEKGTVKLSDFGGSAKINENDEIIFTPMYPSPEVLKTKCGTKESDIYSMAMVIYEIIFKKIQLCDKIKNGDRPILNEEDFVNFDNELNDEMENENNEFKYDNKEKCYDALIKLLNKNWSEIPEERLNAHELSESLKNILMCLKIKSKEGREFWKDLQNENSKGLNSNIPFSLFWDKLEKSSIVNPTSISDNLKKKFEKEISPRVSYNETPDDITMESFNMAIEWHGNFFKDKDSFLQMLELLEKNWFLGNFDKDGIEKFFEDKKFIKDKKFIVRSSCTSKDCPFAIDYYDEASKEELPFKKVQIKKDNGKYISEKFAPNKQFDSLIELIEYCIESGTLIPNSPEFEKNLPESLLPK